MPEIEEILTLFIKTGLERGNSKEELRAHAIKKGYPLETIENVIKKVENSETKEANKLTNTLSKEEYNEKRGIIGHVIGIPRSFIFPLTWTLFFIICGVTIQSIRARSFMALEFFGINLINWIYSLNFFSESVAYSGVSDIIIAFLKDSYYFAVIGGLLSLAWVSIAWILKKMQTKKQEEPIVNHG